MKIPLRFIKVIGCAGLILLPAASPSFSQIEDQLSAYTGRNATGYLQPLADAFGADLNDGLFQFLKPGSEGSDVDLLSNCWTRCHNQSEEGYQRRSGS